MDVEKQVQQKAIERGIEADMRAGVWAGIYAVLCLGLIITSAVFLFSTHDRRVLLTTLEVFHDWGGLRQIFQDSAAYDPRFNLPALEYYTHFDTGGVSIDVMRDLLGRGLMTETQFSNFTGLFNVTTGMPLMGAADPWALQQLSSQFFARFIRTVFANTSYNLPATLGVAGHNYMDPRLLTRLFRVSGCSFPDALAGATPATRSPGCACIAQTYVDFILATGRMANNVTQKARDAAGDQVLRCMDRRVGWRTWVAGEGWTVHPMALALYSNGILFLVCMAYLLSFYHASLFPEHWDAKMRTIGIRTVLVLLAGGLILVLMLHNPLGNLLQVLGLLLSVSTFFFSASRVLDYPSASEGSFRIPFVPAPHPLMVCFWLNLPMLIPGPLVAVAMSGYNRDVYAIWGVAIIGSVIGIILQRGFWYIWNDDHQFISVVLPPMLFGLLDLVIVLFLLLFVYYNDQGVYTLSAAVSAVAIFVFLLFIMALLWKELDVFRESVSRAPYSEPDLNQRFTDGEHALVFLVTAMLLCYLTVVGSVDSSRE